MSIKTLGSDLPYGKLSFGNGFSVKQEISPTFPILDLGKFSWISDFDIQAPNVKIEPSLQTIIEKENERLSYKVLRYDSNELRDWRLGEIMYSQDGKQNNAKAKLTRDGKSAVIGEVSRKINASSLDHTTKFLLSQEALYIYALSYAIYYEKVPDAEGIYDRVILAVENRVKPYFNKVLALEIIRDKHLELSDTQKKKIMREAGHTNISYLKGEPVKAIQKIITKYLDYGKLHTLVDKFFESGEIDPSKGTPQVRQLMVKYLIDIGLTPTDEDLNVPDVTMSDETEILEEELLARLKEDDESKAGRESSKKAKGTIA